MKHIKRSLVITLLVCLPGCIALNDLAEGFNAVPYDGMYTVSYTSTKDDDGTIHYWKKQFPIGFFGSMNVKFWNAYGDYRNTRTYERYKEWKALPEEQKRVEITREEWPYGSR